MRWPWWHSSSLQPSHGPRHVYDVSTEYGPGALRIYGLALDGVTAVTVGVGGASRTAAFAHNAFFLNADDLGDTKGIAGTATATMGDGTTRTVSFHVSSLEPPVAPS